MFFLHKLQKKYNIFQMSYSFHICSSIMKIVELIIIIFSLFSVIDYISEIRLQFIYLLIY